MLAATAREWSATRQGQVWLDAGWIWLMTRAVFVALTVLVPALLVKGGGGTGIHALFDRWVTQDGAHFAYIAQYGYTPLWRTAFWPLYPLLEHVTGPLTGHDYGLAGLLIANAAFFGALVALRELAERELGAETARRAALYLAIFPSAFYFFAPYSEALFLLLSLTAFLALRQRRWWLAGLLGCAATLTRSAGMLLLVPFAVEFLMALRMGKARWWQGAYAALIPAAAGIYSAYLALAHRDPLAYIHSEGYWGRSLQWPWQTVVIALHGLGSAGGSKTFGAVHLALNLAALVVFVALGVLAARALPPAYGAYAIALLLYISLFPANNPVAAVQGEGRLVLMIFPVFMLLGAWGRRRYIHEALVWGMLPLLTLACAHYLLGLATA